jgi:hypothetical protein
VVFWIETVEDVADHVWLVKLLRTSHENILAIVSSYRKDHFSIIPEPPDNR